MKNAVIAAFSGIFVNFFLFLLKLYVGISSGFLSIYCDAINNLGDVFSCAVGLAGIFLAVKMSEKKGRRIQSLCSFVIGLIVTVTGIYFIYNGIERLLYPVPVSYAQKHAVLLILTIAVKILMGTAYIFVNKKANSPVFKMLVLDSFMDCAVTITVLMGFMLIAKIHYAADGIFGIITGLIITVSAVKSVFLQAKFLINE